MVRLKQENVVWGQREILNCFYNVINHIIKNINFKANYIFFNQGLKRFENK